MCGIGALLEGYSINIQQDIFDFLDLRTIANLTLEFLPSIKRRGPDSFREVNLNCAKGKRISLVAAVLHLQGLEICPQPQVSDNGNVLCWNGEVFGGFEHFDCDQNDTLAVLREFTSKGVMEVVTQIHGPFSFIFWENSTSSLWFGRDRLGRRSLCIQIDEGRLHLSSTVCSQGQWQELPNRGIFRLDCSQMDANLEHIHWPKVVLEKVVVEDPSALFLQHLSESVRRRVTLPVSAKALQHPSHALASDSQLSLGNHASIAILYSGGIDSHLLAALTATHLDETEPIDLLTICFTGDDHLKSWDTPDRLTAINGLLELQRMFPNHDFRLVEINITLNELETQRQHVEALLLPSDTVMDLNIGSIFWFGGLGRGVLYPGNYQQMQSKLIRYAELDIETRKQLEVAKQQIAEEVSSQVDEEFPDEHNQPKKERLKRKKAKRQRAKFLIQSRMEKLQAQLTPENIVIPDDHDKSFEYVSGARVLLVGLGADELCGGYGRHRTAFRKGGKDALQQELKKDYERLWQRNLGRDDRLISDHGREVRHPFLDETFVEFIQSLDVFQICDLTLPPGIGDKKILRDAAKMLGCEESASLVKRAIQFGTRMAHKKVAGYVKLTSEMTTAQLVNPEQIQNPDDPEEILTKKYNKAQNKPNYV